MSFENDSFRYEDKTIISIDVNNGVKTIKYLGYGYYAEDTDTPYRTLEYCWFEVPLKDALEVGAYEYESKHLDEYKQYIGDCTREECEMFYEQYDNGKAPKVLHESELDMDTPNGMYILFNSPVPCEY